MFINAKLDDRCSIETMINENYERAEYYHNFIT